MHPDNEQPSDVHSVHYKRRGSSANHLGNYPRASATAHDAAEKAHKDHPDLELQDGDLLIVVTLDGTDEPIVYVYEVQTGDVRIVPEHEVRHGGASA